MKILYIHLRTYRKCFLYSTTYLSKEIMHRVFHLLEEITNVSESILTLATTAKPTQFVTRPESTVSASWVVIIFPPEVKPRLYPNRPKKEKNPKNTIMNTTTKPNPILHLLTLTIPPIKPKNCWLETWPVTWREFSEPKAAPPLPHPDPEPPLPPPGCVCFHEDKYNWIAFPRDSISNFNRNKY